MDRISSRVSVQALTLKAYSLKAKSFNKRDSDKDELVKIKEAYKINLNEKRGRMANLC